MMTGLTEVLGGHVAHAEGEYRLYGELASWWPLISPPADYESEAAYLGAVLACAGPDVHEVLDLGSGGGHVALHLKDRFSLTLVDISPDMLATSQKLNPESEHVRGDMRTLRLGRSFDAVLVHDAVDYITTARDLGEVIATAFAHCRPGGVALFVPDYVKDTFRELTGSGGGGTDGTGRQATFREWTWDPDPADDWVQAEYEFTLREADGTVRVIRENHKLGAFSFATWGDLLAAAGFEVDQKLADGQACGQRHLPGSRPDHLIACRRPAA